MASNDDFDDDVMDKIADKQLDGWSKIKVLGGNLSYFKT